MISTYSNSIQTISTNGLLSFNTDRILTGCTATLSNDNQTFQLNKPGFYYITFNGTGQATAATGEVTVQLRQNSTVVPGASSSFTATAIGDNQNMSFTTIIKVAPTCCCKDVTTIDVICSGVDATFSNTNINITKLC